MRILGLVLAATMALTAMQAWAQTAPGAAPRAWTTSDPEGQRGQFQFLGQKIGDPITKAFPNFKTAKDQFGYPICQTTIGLPRFWDCAYQDVRQMVDGIPRLDYGGVEVKFVNMRYVDEKLVGFTMGFDAAVFEPLARVLHRQFGKPFSVENALWKDRLGLEYNTYYHIWNTPHGEMTLRERWVNSDSGMLKLIEPAAERLFQDLRYRQVVVE